MKKVISFIFIIIFMMVCLTGCEESKNNNKNTSNVKNNSVSNAATKTNTKTSTTTTNTNTQSSNSVMNYDYKTAAENQMKLPEVGEQIAIMHVRDYGDIYMKFFPNVAPKAVENFVKHSQDGYYNGLTFHRVINEFMIQGGDPLGTGAGGESIWGSGFGTELDLSLVPYRGSLCMAMSSLPNSIGSQFFITQAHYSETMSNTLKNYGYPTKLLEQYKIYGGYLSLYTKYTVFGQVFEGMEIVDEIAKVETNSNDKPLTDVIIDSIEITDYSE